MRSVSWCCACWLTACRPTNSWSGVRVWPRLSSKGSRSHRSARGSKARVLSVEVRPYAHDLVSDRHEFRVVDA